MFRHIVAAVDDHQGNVQALRQAGIEPSPQALVEGDNWVESGYRACRELLASGVPFTALLASNDDMAVGALRALHEAGRRVPEQVSLFGFDDEPLAAYLTPALSTVHIPIESMSECAMQQALAGRCAYHCRESGRRCAAFAHCSFPSIPYST